MAEPEASEDDHRECLSGEGMVAVVIAGVAYEALSSCCMDKVFNCHPINFLTCYVQSTTGRNADAGGAEGATPSAMPKH